MCQQPALAATSPLQSAGAFSRRSRSLHWLVMCSNKLACANETRVTGKVSRLVAGKLPSQRALKIKAEAQKNSSYQQATQSPIIVPAVPSTTTAQSIEPPWSTSVHCCLHCYSKGPCRTTAAVRREVLGTPCPECQTPNYLSCPSSLSWRNRPATPE